MSQFTGRYRVGDKVMLHIGERKTLHTEVIECVMRKGPHYKLDWAKSGFDELLNTVCIPEKSLKPEPA